MNKIIFILVTTLSIGLGTDLEMSLKQLDKWRFEYRDEEGFRHWSARLDGMHLPARKISTETPFPAERLASLVQDLSNYDTILKSAKAMEFMVMEDREREAVAYQFIDVPFFSDRHYVYRFNKYRETDIGKYESSWRLIPSDELQEGLLYELEKEYGEAVYIDKGAGYFIFEDIGGGKSRFSYTLYMDIGGYLPDGLMDRSNSRGIKMLMMDIIDAAGKLDSITKEAN